MLPSHQTRTLKTNLLSLISNFSTHYFETGTICLLFLSSHVFTALEFDSNHFGILLGIIVKPRNHNEIKPPIGKIFWKYKPIRHYIVTSWNKLSSSFINKVYDNYDKVSYLQRNKRCCNLETTVEKKINFSHLVRFIRSYYLTTFQIPVAATLIPDQNYLHTHKNGINYSGGPWNHNTNRKNMKENLLLYARFS